MNYKNKLHNIKAFIFDFDGVMTDGSVWMFADRETVRTGNIKDGFAIQYAVKKGYQVAVISGAVSMSINNRMESLGVKDIFTGAGNKISIFKSYLEEKKLLPEEVLYMGDDIPDYEIMRQVGVATCPSDAAQEIKDISDYISMHPGGKGCVRDVIEQVLRIQKNWFHSDAVNW